ncbi:MAG TPA: DUF429 domain-containing protein [Nitrospira sp.]|nr:DUF429 domain-containing protein [Nitrospira sp.]
MFSSLAMSPSPQIVVGVDVGGVKKGFHAVALRDGTFFDKLAACNTAAIVEWCRRLGASTVGIDAPCKWSLTGKQRPCERELARMGIRAFATPCFKLGQLNPFYGWMLNGAELFRAFAKHYRLFDGQGSTSRPLCFETFPHAAACALTGIRLSAKNKRVERRRLLRQAGVTIDALTTIDEVDAALCALTARHFLAGTFTAYGNEAEGYIVVPAI